MALPDEASITSNDCERVTGVEVLAGARVLLNSSSTFTVGSLYSEHDTVLGHLAVPLIHRDSGLVKDSEAVWEEGEESLIFVTLLNSHSCHMVGQFVIR